MLRRLLEALSSLAILITLVFLLAHLMPGGPAYAILGLRATPASVDAVDLELGRNVSLPDQYIIWWGHVLTGDLGTSTLLNRPVTELIGAYAANSLAVQLSGLCAGLILGLALGTVHGIWRRTWPGALAGATELSLYAMPTFFIGTVLVLIFSTAMGWLPAEGTLDFRQPNSGLLDRIRHLILPASTLGLALAPVFARYVALGIDRELRAGYVLAARGRGLSFSRILLFHVAPNAARPVITMVGLSLPTLIGGGVVVESLFAYPGLGWLLCRSALAHDDPMLIGIVLVLGVVTIIGNALADAVLGLIDPRGA